MQLADIISGMNSNKELAYGLQYCQIRWIPHDVLDDVYVQGTDYFGYLLAPFTLALLERKYSQISVISPNDSSLNAIKVPKLNKVNAKFSNEPNGQSTE